MKRLAKKNYDTVIFPVLKEFINRGVSNTFTWNEIKSSIDNLGYTEIDWMKVREYIQGLLNLNIIHRCSPLDYKSETYIIEKVLD